jgi:phage-related protein
VNQLILNAKIESDWLKTLELRENGLKIEIVRVDQKITQIKLESTKNNAVLDCQVINKFEVCLCNK